jgi:hypothetical protein
MTNYYAEPQPVKKTEVEKKFIFAVDLGQVNDYTALIILERQQEVTTTLVCTVKDPSLAQGKDWKPKITFKDALYSCRYIERMRNLSYPVMIERIRKVIENPEIENRYKLVLDQTGVGRPIYDLFKLTGLDIFGVTITGGNEDHKRTGSEWSVAKCNLVGVTQVISQANPPRLKYAADLADLDLLRNEISNFKVIVSKSANELFSVREGLHDDLILALSLGLWFGEIAGSPRPTRARSWAG